MAFAAAHPDIDDILQASGLGDHPAVVEAAAILGRQAAHAASPAPATRTTETEGTKPVNEPDMERYDNTMRDFNDRIALAQSEGKSKLADQLYAQQMSYIGRVKGNQSIVDGRRTA